MQNKQAAILGISIVFCVMLCCLTILIAKHIVPWESIAGAGVAMLLYISRSPFGPPLEAEIVNLVQRTFAEALANSVRPGPMPGTVTLSIPPTAKAPDLRNMVTPPEGIPAVTVPSTEKKT
jgi:hypothetical protein